MIRTTLRLDDDLLRQAKKRAVDKGVTFTALVEEALRLVLNTSRTTKHSKPVTLPSSGRGGLRPGIDLNDTSSLMDVMDGRE